VLVLVYANSSWAENYADVWQTKLTVGLGGVEEANTSYPSTLLPTGSARMTSATSVGLIHLTAQLKEVWPTSWGMKASSTP
jgi:hypothetical protein